jgi:hypothetical protein
MPSNEVGTKFRAGGLWSQALLFGLATELVAILLVAVPFIVGDFGPCGPSNSVLSALFLMGLCMHVPAGLLLVGTDADAARVVVVVVMQFAFWVLMWTAMSRLGRVIRKLDGDGSIERPRNVHPTD